MRRFIMTSLCILTLIISIGNFLGTSCNETTSAEDQHSILDEIVIEKGRLPAKYSVLPAFWAEIYSNPGSKYLSVSDEENDNF